MTYIGLDIGTHKCGVALGSADSGFARPHATISTNLLISKLSSLVGVYQPIAGFIVGRSESGFVGGTDNPVVTTIDAIKKHIAKKFPNIPIHSINEFGSSGAVFASLQSGEGRPRNATRYRSSEKHTGTVDASAAAIILQRFFDAQKHIQ